MYLDKSKVTIKGKTYSRCLLRESFRENGKVKHRTIANLSQCSPEEIAAITLAFEHKHDAALLHLFKVAASDASGIFCRDRSQKKHRGGLFKAFFQRSWGYSHLPQDAGVDPRIMGENFSSKGAQERQQGTIAVFGTRSASLQLPAASTSAETLHAIFPHWSSSSKSRRLTPDTR